MGHPVTRNEILSVLVLALGFGLVGIDRFLIVTLYPTIAADLDLGYGDIGVITGALALAWGVAALLMGNLSDRIGQRRVLVVSLVVFSLLIGASGLATGLLGLILVRVVMGFADGAFTPASIAATIKVSPPERHGRNVGLQQTMLVLFGLGLSPLIVSFLLYEGVDWRYIFVLFSVPGLLLAYATRRVIPEFEAEKGSTSSVARWREVLRHRNIWVLMGGMFCWLTCLITMSAFLPNYLIDHFAFDASQMGIIMSAIGFGAMSGTVVLSSLSDVLGRKPVMIIGTIGAFAGLVALVFAGPDILVLFWLVFAINFCNNALITMTVGPIPTETVPAALMTTASGVVIAAGEIFGGGAAPIVAGLIAERFGISHVFWFPIVMMGVGVVLALSLKETHPTFEK